MTMFVSLFLLFGSSAAVDVKKSLTRRVKKTSSEVASILEVKGESKSESEAGVFPFDSISQAFRDFTGEHLSTWDDALNLNPAMLEGCSDIFMDVGANRGTHVRKLFEPEKYPDSPYLSIFNATFGSPEHRRKPSAETGICAFGFEANPRQVDNLKAIEKAYAKKGW